MRGQGSGSERSGVGEREARGRGVRGQGSGSERSGVGE